MRLYNLDYLRGLAALSILAFHYTSWTIGKFSSENVLGRVGIYGVSLFYVLSGLTLYYVYHKKLNVKTFFIKRAYRILPLLALVTILSMILSRTFPGFMIVLLNLTGLFGLFAWDQGIGMGTWSIGNEVVFYLFLPAFILLNRKLFWILITLIFAVHLVFAFYILDPSGTLDEQNLNYTNPLGHLFLFTGGFLIGYLFKGNVSKVVNLSILAAALLLFVFYPVSGDLIHLITGWNRVLFTLICFALCFSFYKLTIHFPTFIERPLTMLGEASYSVYLLHPLVFNTVNLFIKERLVVAIISVPVTLVTAYYCYKYFEVYFIELGKSKRTKFNAERQI